MANYKELKLEPGEAAGLSELWNAGMVPPDPPKRRKHAAKPKAENKKPITKKKSK